MNRDASPDFAPATLPDLLGWVRSKPHVLPVGAGTKPRPGLVPERFTRISTRNLRGIIEYEPDEFIVTAHAGTPVADLAAALAERGQYLPFDPLLLDAGATLGGTIAAGTNGSGRFRFGGIRDFVLGVRFLDGLGRHLRVGGKVVKNAAGFDVSKFLVGSLGRFGFITEATLKVFPRPLARLTLRLRADHLADAARIVTDAANSRWEIDALDIVPGDLDIRLRLAGPESALTDLAREILDRWPGEILSATDAIRLWDDLRELRWAHPGGVLVKIPLTPDLVVPVAGAAAAIPGARLHVAAGGNVAWTSFPAEAAAALAPFSDRLRQLGLAGLTLWGDDRTPLRLGFRPDLLIATAVKTALDPTEKFPDLDEPAPGSSKSEPQ